MRVKVFLSTTLILAVFSGGCNSAKTVESTTIPSADTYQSYVVGASKIRTNVTATFHVESKSGATVDLDAPSKVENNGKPIPEIAPSGWKGTTYEDSSNNFIGQHQFVYTDAKGNVFRNEINVTPLEFGEKPINRIRRYERTLIPLSRPVGKDETVSASIVGRVRPDKNRPNETSFDSVDISLDPSRSALMIEPDNLKNFIDKIDINLTLERNEPLKEKTAKGGDIRITYEAQKISTSLRR